MSGTVWALVAGVGFGLFQSVNRRGVHGMDVYMATFVQLVVSFVVLAGISLATEDMGVLLKAPLSAILNFAAAGFFHFFVGWTFLNASQKRIGAARTSPLIGTTPLFATVIAALTLREFPGLLALLGIGLIVAGAYGISRWPGNANGPALSQPVETGWRASWLGLSAAFCWALSPIFIRAGLEQLPSPLLGVTVGLAASALGYGLLLLFQPQHRATKNISGEAWFFKVLAGLLVGLSTWTRWIALDLAPIAVVLAITMVSTPVVILISPYVVGRHLEQVTATLWAGAGLIIGGALMLTFISLGENMVVDTHAHIIVSEILREANPIEEWRPRVVWENGKQFIEYGPKRIGSAIREFVSPEKVLAEMAKSGMDAVLLSPWVSLFRYEAKPEESLGSCQIQNDALIVLTEKYPRQVAALGMLPLQDVKLAVKELERIMGAGLKGVEIGTHVNGVYLGDAQFRLFWEACESLGAFVFIHPVEGGGRAELRDYYMWNVIGNPMDTTIAAGHLILSGVMEAYPGLKILLAHGGGTLPYIHGRLDRGFKQRPEINKVISKPPTEYLKQFYFDTITHDVTVLRSLVELVGADHVLLGSDYPFDMGNENPVDLVRAAELGAKNENKILGENAIRLLNWEA